MIKIVFVDDDRSIQEVMKLIFKKADYDLTIFSNGTPVLKNGYTLPDVFILDKQLPDIDGLEICRWLKSQHKTKDIPVIMVSANPDIQALSKEAGADGAIEKPFTLQGFRKTVAKYMG